jgi:hypothetical protein
MPTQRAHATHRTTPRFSRTGRAPSTGGWRGRRQPQRSGAQKAIDSLTGALEGFAGGSSKKRRGASSRRARGGKAGGIALASAAAGVAFKNRNRLMALFNRKGDDANAPAQTNPTEAGTRATSGPVDPARTGDIAPTDPGNRPDIPAA